MKRLIVASVLFSLFCVAASAQKREQQPKPVSVFVTSVGEVNGFTDPSKDNRDTVKDLRESFADRKGLALAASRDDATIVLTVMQRETEGITAGFRGQAARDRVLHVKFTTGEFETDLRASAQGGTMGSGGAWGKAAGKIAKQVEEWVKANRERLAQ